MATSLSPSTIKLLAPYLKLFMSRTFPKIHQEWNLAERDKESQRVHSDGKSSQSKDPTKSFFTSHLLYLQKSGGGGQRAVAFVEGRNYIPSRVHWQVSLPEVPEKEVHKDGELAAIIKKAVKEAFLAAGGDEDDIE